MDDLSSLYLSRKLGKGMGAGYVLSSLSPAILIFLVTAALAFALTFICSVSSTIDRMLAVLGSGSVLCYSQPDSIPEGSELSRVRNSEALAYSEQSSGAVMVKGVEEDYFSGLRADALELEWLGEDARNPVILSSSLARSLSLSCGDRLTLLLYEDGRARPVLCTVSGIFKSVYPQLDRRLMYVPFSLLAGSVQYEILLPEGMDADKAAKDMGMGVSYRALYRSLYSNVQSSVSLLYVILLLVSLLAAFFSSDIAEAYIMRDRKDIAHLLLLGLEERKLRSLYFRLTLSSCALALAPGLLLGLFAASLSPYLVSALSGSGNSVLDYYVLSFQVRVPVARLMLMALLMLLSASLSVAFKLARAKLADIFLL